jgi:hypothetical protein
VFFAVQKWVIDPIITGLQLILADYWQPTSLVLFMGAHPSV